MAPETAETISQGRKSILSALHHATANPASLNSLHIHTETDSPNLSQKTLIGIYRYHKTYTVDSSSSMKNRCELEGWTAVNL